MKKKITKTGAICFLCKKDQNYEEPFYYYAFDHVQENGQYVEVLCKRCLKKQGVMMPKVEQCKF